MKYYNDNPNLTIVLPVNCNAECSFCSWRGSKQDTKTSPNFLVKLSDTISFLPSQFKQVTISGGEPSLYERLEEVFQILNDKKSITKVVFTTNGTNLVSLIHKRWFVDTVDFINISRHHHEEKKNDLVFETKTINNFEIGHIAQDLNLMGIPVNFNCVLSKSICEAYDGNFVENFKNFAQEVGVNSITFRADYFETTEPHYLEQCLGKPMNISSCEVCRKATYLRGGMSINFTNSHIEPTDILGKGILYEAVVQPNGDLTADWRGNIKIQLGIAMQEAGSGSVSSLYNSGCGKSRGSC